MPNSKRLRVLWLCSWYPSKVEPFSGDFIQRHARAVALLHDVHVIHVVKLNESLRRTGLKSESTGESGLSEEVIYYTSFSGWLGKIHSQLTMAWQYYLAVGRYVKLKGRPDILHYHTAMHLGLTAFAVRMAYRMPYLLSEHWSGFYSNAEETVSNLNLFRQLSLRRIIARSISMQVVSVALQEAIRKRYSKDHIIVIPNVVDVDMFRVDSEEYSPFTFIHISEFSKQKGADHLLTAVKLLLEKGHRFNLQLIGVRNADSTTMLKELNNVAVFGEVSHKTVADLLRKADAMVHPSFYETFGCVLIEAFASGIPVVAYDLPVFKELIVSGKNGIVANQMTPESLADAMEAMMSTIERYNADQIRAEAISKYSMPVVAAQFDAWYRTCLDVTGPASKD